MNTYFIDTPEAFEQLKAYVEAGGYDTVALDVETDSRSEKTAKLYGVGLCFDPDEAYYLPIRTKSGELWWDADTLQGIADWVKSVCETHRLIGHNLVYDVLVIENNWGYDLAPLIYSDTILLKHALDEEPPFGLKEVAVKYLGAWADKAQEALYANIEANGGRTTKEHMEMFKADSEILGEYCAWDVILTRRLFDLFEPRLHDEGLAKLFYEEETMPLYREVTIPMKRNGFPIDVAHFKRLKAEINDDLLFLEQDIYAAIKADVAPFERRMLDKDYPIKRAGSFPKALAAVIGAPLPEKDGKVTMAKKAIQTLCAERPDFAYFYSWILDPSIELPEDLLRQAQRVWWQQDNPDQIHVFNLRSNDHLAWLLVDTLGIEPDSRTETGKPQLNEDFLETIQEEVPWVAKLLELKKLNKLLGTYIEGILDRQVDGVVYTSFLQFGTTSGRFSSRDPNLQNLPRVKGEDADVSPLVLKYTNAIRAGFVAPAGWKIVDADYSALEPRCFAHMSNDPGLQLIFHHGEDMYSSIAKRVFNLEGSVFKKDADFIGKLYPEKRQIVKTLALAVTYGAEAGRIASLLDIPKGQAQQIIDDYLDAYPGLKDYILSSHRGAKRDGKVSTIYGRVRHLDRVARLNKAYGDKLLDYGYVRSNGLEMERRLYKNGLNNSTNFRIQGLAAHVINRASITINRAFRERGLSAYIALQIHDQLCVLAPEDQAEAAKRIVQSCMESAVKLSVPLVAEPKIADNLRDSK